jgi:hypothetical protein
MVVEQAKVHYFFQEEMRAESGLPTSIYDVELMNHTFLIHLGTPVFNEFTRCCRGCCAMEYFYPFFLSASPLLHNRELLRGNRCEFDVGKIHNLDMRLAISRRDNGSQLVEKVGNTIERK